MALDSMRMAEQQAAQLAALQADTVQLTGADSLTQAQLQQNALRDKYGIFAVASQGEEQTWTIENKLQ